MSKTLFMSKTNRLFKALAISAVIFSLFSFNNFAFVNVYTLNPAVDTTVVVNHKNGVNIRDKNCNIINTAGYGQTLSLEPGPSYRTMTCKINGKSLISGSYSHFGRDGISGFVALDFVSPIIFGGNIDLGRLVKDKNGLEYSKVYLNGTNNLNLRNTDCQVFKNVLHDVSLFVPPVGGGSFVCRVGNKFYDMTPVTQTLSNSPVYFAASVFLR